MKSTIFLPFVPERGSFYGRVDVNMKTHTFSFDVAADDDQMKVISAPSFKDGDQVVLGATHFLYRSVNKELRVVPDISQNDVYFGYNNEIRLFHTRRARFTGLTVLIKQANNLPIYRRKCV